MTGEQYILDRLDEADAVQEIVQGNVINVTTDEVIAPAIIVRQEGRSRERFLDGSCAETWHVRVDFYSTDYNQYRTLAYEIEAALDVAPCMLDNELSARIKDSEAIKLPTMEVFPLWHGWQQYKVFGTAEQLDVEAPTFNEGDLIDDVEGALFFGEGSGTTVSSEVDYPGEVTDELETYAPEEEE